MEDRGAQVEQAKREAVILECKSACFHVTFHVMQFSLLVLLYILAPGRHRRRLMEKGKSRV